MSKINWLQKAANLALRPLGYQAVPAKVAAQFNLPVFKFFGLSYAFSDWKIGQYITDGYNRNASLYSIVNRITRTASMCPFKVYRVKDRKKALKIKSWTGENATRESIQKALLLKEQVYEEDNNHPLQKLIDKPNPWQGGAEFVMNSIGFKLLTGNRFLFKNVLDAGANKGKPFSIFNLPPQHMMIKGGGTLFEVTGYTLNLGQPLDIPADLIIHSREPNYDYDTSGGHLWGLSKLSAASRNIDRSSAGEERSVAMMNNAGAAGVMYAKDGFKEGGQAMTLEQAGALKRKLNEEVLGTGNAGKIALANQEIGYINFALTAVEMDVLNLEKWSLQQLCNVFGVPYILFSSDSSSYNNIREAKKELITMAIIPELASLRDDWNAIAALYGDDIYVDYDISVYPEMQEDLEKTAARLEKMPYVKWNEKRLATGFDEDNEHPLMNKYIIPQGLQLLDDLDPANLDRVMDGVDEGDG